MSRTKITTVGERLHHRPLQLNRRLCPIEESPPSQSHLSTTPIPSSLPGPLFPPRSLPPLKPPKPMHLPSVLPENVFQAVEFCPDVPYHTMSEMTRVDVISTSIVHRQGITTDMVSLLFRLTLLRDAPAVARLKQIPKEKLRAELLKYSTANGRLHKGGWMRTVETLLPKSQTLPPLDRNSIGRVFDAYMKGANTETDLASFSSNIGYLLDYHEPFAALNMCFVLFEPWSRSPRYCTRLELETMIRVFYDEVAFLPNGVELAHGQRCVDGLKIAVSNVFYDMKGRCDVNEFLKNVRADPVLAAVMFKNSPEEVVAEARKKSQHATLLVF